MSAVNSRTWTQTPQGAALALLTDGFVTRGVLLLTELGLLGGGRILWFEGVGSWFP